MPTVKDKATGDVVSQQPYTAEGTQRAKTIVQANPDWEIDYAPNGKTDGAQRMESYQLGGQIPGQPGFGQRPSPIPNPYGEVGGGNIKPVNPGINPLGTNIEPPPPIDLWEEGGKVKK